MRLPRFDRSSLPPHRGQALDGWLKKRSRRLATRFETLTENILDMVKLAMLEWLRKARLPERGRAQAGWGRPASRREGVETSRDLFASIVARTTKVTLKWAEIGGVV